MGMSSPLRHCNALEIDVPHLHVVVTPIDRFAFVFAGRPRNIRDRHVVPGRDIGYATKTRHLCVADRARRESFVACCRGVG